MRNRGLALLTLAVLAFTACQGATSTGSVAPPASVAPGASTAATAAARNILRTGRRYLSVVE